MKDNNVLHCMDAEPKFMQSFIDFIKENFDYSKHKFIIREHFNDMKVNIDSNTIFLPKSYSKFKRLLIFMYQMNKADKIILHGLFHSDIIYALFLQPWLLKKCYWVMWGGDFYFPETKSKIHQEVIKKIGNCIPVTKGDYLYIQKHYDTKAKYHKCISYIRSVKIDNIDIKESNLNVRRILVGNSATETNRHLDAFSLLKAYSDIEVIVPLSYGSSSYAEKILAQGRELFKNFTPLVDFIEYKEYLNLLGSIDIVIFNHNRQQSLGNIILIIAMGKTLYLSRENNVYDMLKDMGISFFDINFLKDSIREITLKEKQKNKKIILEQYSEEKAIKEWRKIFE